MGAGLSVLGYADVKSTPVNSKIRQELDYLDREVGERSLPSRGFVFTRKSLSLSQELLHVIAHQSDLLKKRDTRLKDLEHYTDGLLVKIVEQCPTILQVRHADQHFSGSADDVNGTPVSF